MKQFIAIFAFYLLSSSAASACDSAFIKFGSSVDTVVDAYNLPPMFALDTTIEGRFELPIRGKQFCNKLPKNTKVSLVFLNNELVQTKIRKTGDSQALLTFAEQYLGEASKKPNTQAGHKRNFQYTWNEKGSYAALYSIHNKGTAIIEYLDISSTEKKHRNALQDQSQQHEDNLKMRNSDGTIQRAITR